MKYAYCEVKKQSVQWGHTHSPKKQTKCHQALSARKIMTTIICDNEGVILVDFFERDSTLNVEWHCETL